MEKTEGLKLHGVWALNIKGVSHHYNEENLRDDSESLLRYNPVYKKVAVIVHNESPIIVEYIDETWKDPPLLPRDPYTRARVYFDEKAVREAKEHLKALKEGLKEDFSTDKHIVIGSTSCWIRVLSKFFGVEMVSKETTPLLCRRLAAVEGYPVAQEAQLRHGRAICSKRN